MENIVRTGARVLITANAGCLLQIEREARVANVPLKVMHPMELLDLSYRREKLEM
jgi:glycolate oxidase iron-sulfur subunit